MDDNLHPEELKETALAPSDFEIVAGQMSPRLVREKGFHPDDQWRESRYERPKTENCS